MRIADGKSAADGESAIVSAIRNPQSAMKANGSVYVAAVFAVLVGYFTYQWWFNPSRAVKRRLGEIAAALSIPPQEAEVGRIARLAQLRKYLAPDIRVRVGDPPQEITPRDTVLTLVASFRPAADDVNVRFTDTQVFVDTEAAAHAYMTVEVVTPDRQSGQPTIDSRSASVDLAKVDREWVVTTAELKPIPTRP
jgi:hypothetical protein